jgi:hypothetical protein
MIERGVNQASDDFQRESVGSELFAYTKTAANMKMKNTPGGPQEPPMQPNTPDPMRSNTPATPFTPGGAFSKKNTMHGYPNNIDYL